MMTMKIIMGATLRQAQAETEALLENGWRRESDPDGNVFWRHEESRGTSWLRPEMHQEVEEGDIKDQDKQVQQEQENVESPAEGGEVPAEAQVPPKTKADEVQSLEAPPKTKVQL